MIKNSTINYQIIENNLLFQLYGEIDHHSAKNLREEIDQLILAHRPSEVIFSLCDIDFMDSAGLGLILGRYTKIKEIGAKLILENPTEQIDKILKLAGIEKMIQIRRTTEATA